VPGLYSLVRRRWQVLSSSKTAQEQLDEAEALVLQSRTKASQAKSRLEEHRGLGALPNAENPQSADMVETWWRHDICFGPDSRNGCDCFGIKVNR